jgi:ATP-dependent Lon protease
MATAFASALSGRAVLRDVGMTGEITLRGRVLPVGGVREKIHVAHRLKLNVVILPKKNQKDLDEIPRHILNALDIRLVDSMDEVLAIALKPTPQTKQSKSSIKKGQTGKKIAKKSS